jgi:N-acetylmuramoyl-L-alanine amidase
MGISIFSWIVPFLKIGISPKPITVQSTPLNFVQVIANTNSGFEQDIIEKTASFNWDALILGTCIAISALFVIRFIQSLWKIKFLIKNYPQQSFRGLKLVMTDVKGTPFSFFKYIFWNNAINLEDQVGQKILGHELVHVQQRHSFDKLIIELQFIIGWFNPILWLLRKELYLIHEFIADEKSIENKDASVLANLLLVSAYPKQQHVLSNYFFFSPIKRRIQMFTQTPNTTFSYVRRLFILPVMAILILLFAFRNTPSNARPIVKLDKQYTVVIDAGHGGTDDGAPGLEGSTEKEITLRIAQKIKEVNNNSNIKIVLTRTSDNMLTVVDRTKLANDVKADLFISIHLNNADDKNASGSLCYVPAKKSAYIQESTLLAKNILSATNSLYKSSKLITTKDRGIWVIENVNMPAVLMECGYISNVKDYQFAKTNETVIANGILSGVESYLANSKK